MNYNIRWMIKDDIDLVVEIEKDSFSQPWSHKDFLDCLKNRSNIGKVIIVDNNIVGFILYELMPKGFYIINIAINPNYRRRGYARAMVDQLIDKLGSEFCNTEMKDKRNYVNSYISEERFHAHLFFKSMGFKAVSIEKDFFKDDEGIFDAYHFLYKTNDCQPQDEFASNLIAYDAEDCEGI